MRKNGVYVTETEQQRLFEQTRARIQRNVAEVAALAQTSLDPRQFFPRFLELAVASLNAEGGAIWSIQSNGQVERIAEQRFATSCYDTDPSQKNSLDRVLTQTITTGKPHVVAAGGPMAEPHQADVNCTPHPFFFIPILLGNRVVFLMQIWLSQAGDPKTYQDIVTFLSSLGSQATLFLRNYQEALSTVKQQDAQIKMSMQAELLGQTEVQNVASIVSNFTVDILSADLACVFERKHGHKWTLKAASNQDQVDVKSHQSRRLLRLAEALEEEPKGRVVPVENSNLDDEIKAELGSDSVQEIAWRHITVPPAQQPGYLLLALKYAPQRISPSAPAQLEWIGQQAEKAFETALHFHHLPLRPLLNAGSRATRAWKEGRRVGFAILFGFLIAGIVAMIMPVPFKVTAACTVVPEVRTLVVPEASGRIMQVLVEEGQFVPKGGEIARLYDEEYTTQLAVLRQQMLRWQVEAGRAQAMNNEAERKLAEINMRREEEAIRRLEYLRDKTILRAPADGIILTKNLKHREGEAVEMGKPFCEMACGNGYDLVLDLKQTDLGVVLEALERGKPLDVDFILHAHADTPLKTTLSERRQISEMPEPKANGSFFLATLPLPSQDEIGRVLKPGYTGKAKIRLGYRPLGYVLIRPFLNYWRVEWGL